MLLTITCITFLIIQGYVFVYSFTSTSTIVIAKKISNQMHSRSFKPAFLSQKKMKYKLQFLNIILYNSNNNNGNNDSNGHMNSKNDSTHNSSEGSYSNNSKNNNNNNSNNDNTNNYSTNNIDNTGDKILNNNNDNNNLLPPLPLPSIATTDQDPYDNFPILDKILFSLFSSSVTVEMNTIMKNEINTEVDTKITTKMSTQSDEKSDQKTGQKVYKNPKNYNELIRLINEMSRSRSNERTNDQGKNMLKRLFPAWLLTQYKWMFSAPFPEVHST